MTDDTCPICKKTDQIQVLQSVTHQDEFIVSWICGCCSHAWRTEPWKYADQVEFFDQADYTHLDSAQKTIASNTKLLKRFEQWAGEVAPQPPRKMIDFGCSYGNCLQIFRQRDWEVLGIEISNTSQKILTERGLPWAASIEQAKVPEHSIDAVVISDCICYLPDPIETLQRLRRCMKPSALLFLRQPTRGGLIFLLSKLSRKISLSNSLWLDHIHLFSRKSTELALARAGFTQVRFLKEVDFRRSLKGEIIHRMLRTADLISLGRLDLTLSWTVIAKAGN